VQTELESGFVTRAWSWVESLAGSLYEDHKKDVLYAAIATAWGLMRLAGKTVETGSTGVKFSFGRVTRVCEPGFYPLIPVFQTIRIVPTRARTLELPTQTLATDDGLAFAVDANVVYRVTDPTKALVEVDDYVAALGQMLALSVHDTLAARDRASLRVSEALDRDLAAAMQERCTAWGIEVERAGFNSIRPLRQTTRITQLESLTRSRAAALAAFGESELHPTHALALLGTPTRLLRRTRALRSVEQRARERRAGRELAARLEAWNERKDDALSTAERLERLEVAKKRLALELAR
jgi:regulator of protease activity HflC (stomatin/prohibitin superfamily)